MAKNLQTVARRALTPCAGHDAFRFADGTTVRDLNDFRHAVGTKSASLVQHHREHYHPWIAQILGDPALARKVERIAHKKTLEGESYRDEMVAVVDERLDKLRMRVL